MEDDLVKAWARAIGLGRALDLFPDEVIAAACQAQAEREALARPDDPAVEPWPPMRLLRRR